MTHNPPHDLSVSLVNAELTARAPDGWVLRVQSAITTADSAPEPDVALVRGPLRRYARAHPGPRDIALLVEVADSTLVQDREEKARIYARARIPVVCVDADVPASKRMAFIGTDWFDLGVRQAEAIPQPAVLLPITKG